MYIIMYKYNTIPDHFSNLQRSFSFFSFQYVNELSGGNQGGQARENRSDILKRKIPL